MRNRPRQVAARAARREIARTESQRVIHGIVTAVDAAQTPATTVAVGPSSHPAYSNDTVAYAVGDKVSLSFNGRVYTIVGRIDTAHTGAPVVPMHDHSPATGRFFRNANQTITHNTETQVTLTSTQGTSTVGSISGGGVALSTSGLFIIGADTAWNASATGFRWIDIRADGAELVNNTCAAADGSIATVQGCTAFVERTAGEVITVHVRHFHGTGLAIQGSGYTGRLATRLWIVRVGP